MSDLPPNPFAGIPLDGQLEIESDGTPAGTKVLVDGKQLNMVQSLRMQVTPDGVVVQIVALAAKAKLRGCILSVGKADPQEPAGRPA